jgi:hypothetical protein
MFVLSRPPTNPLQQLWLRAAQLNIEHGRLLPAFAAKLGDPCACLLSFGSPARLSASRAFLLTEKFRSISAMQKLQSASSRLTCDGAHAATLHPRSTWSRDRRGPEPRPRTQCAAEMGIRSELRHNLARLVRNALIATAVLGGIVALRNRRRRY